MAVFGKKSKFKETIFSLEDDFEREIVRNHKLLFGENDWPPLSGPP